MTVFANEFLTCSKDKCRWLLKVRTVHYFNSLKETAHTFVWTQKMPSANELYRTCLILLYSNTVTDIVICLFRLMSAVFQQHPHFFFS